MYLGTATYIRLGLCPELIPNQVNRTEKCSTRHSHSQMYGAVVGQTKKGMHHLLDGHGPFIQLRCKKLVPHQSV